VANDSAGDIVGRTRVLVKKALARKDKSKLENETILEVIGSMRSTMSDYDILLQRNWRRAAIPGGITAFVIDPRTSATVGIIWGAPLEALLLTLPVLRGQ
jgi:hypothetical protein